jgi:hypothetical protein
LSSRREGFRLKLYTRKGELHIGVEGSEEKYWMESWRDREGTERKMNGSVISNHKADVNERGMNKKGRSNRKEKE